MKTALITGANKSIGFETARQLAQQGYHVFLGSRDLEKGVQSVAALKSEGLTNVEALQIDVTDKGSVDLAHKSVSQKTDVLDLLINNAGISGGFPQNPSGISSLQIREVFNTNLFGAIDVTQAFLPLLSRSANPVIVNVTSGLASLTLHSDPSWKFYAFKSAAYGPSKTALNAFTVSLAHELRDRHFKVNAVDPGFTATDFNQHRGHGDLAGAAAFIVKFATLGAEGPTGKYFSRDYDVNGKECPW
jgi:NAD(P)-dependent dehydrogenase (short-subunit alcohol dehydrogenase family)